jgi:hypothetical protein
MCEIFGLIVVVLDDRIPTMYVFSIADLSGRAVYGMNCFRSLERWDRRLESHSRDGCLCVFILCLCCYVCRYRPCDELIPRPSSPTDCV